MDVNMFTYDKTKYQAANEDGVVIRSIAHLREQIRVFAYYSPKMRFAFMANSKRAEGPVKEDLDDKWTVSGIGGLAANSMVPEFDRKVTKLTDKDLEIVKPHITEALAVFPLLDSRQKKFVTINSVVFS